MGELLGGARHVSSGLRIRTLAERDRAWAASLVSEHFASTRVVSRGVARSFYRALGMRECAVHRDAVTRARARKPEIPERDARGHPIRDEVEYEWRLAP